MTDLNETPAVPEDDDIGEPMTQALTEPNAGAEATPESTPVTETPDDEELGEPTPQYNATQEYEVSSPRSSGTPDVIDIPGALEEQIRSKLEKAPNMDFLRSGNQRNWGEVLKSSLNQSPMAGMYVERLGEEGSDFRQTLRYNNVEMRGRAPTFKKHAGTREVEGEQALLQMMMHLGVGGLFRAPMWNSGIWVTFKPASDTELLELNRLLYSDKINLGRWSYGLALSNTVVYTVDRIFEFALQHVYNTSVKSEELSIQDLRKMILPQDVNSFIWGFLCANYPSGFHYRTACINDPNKCNHVIEANLNLTKLQWVDNSPLTDWQKQHMASMAPNSKTLESVKRYQEEMKRAHSRRVVLNAGTKHEVAFTLRTPTILQWIDQGHRWIGNMVENVNQILGLDADDKERNFQIHRLGQATTLRQYVHWIDTIEYGELSPSEGAEEPSISLIKDLQAIEDTLNAWSAIDSIRDQVIDEVKKYINESTLAVIGVPAYDCPVCQTPQEGETSLPRHTEIIPLDVLQVFFALLAQRLDRIASR